MSLTLKDIKKIAHLSRLAIEEDAIPQFENNLNKLLGLLEQMNAVNTDHIDPISHPLEGIALHLREDKITECLDSHDREKFQKIAPLTAEGLYLVPIVIE